jgi:GNAT superfamily N-acetyltransferase
MEIEIRTGIESDLPSVLKLIKELASFEKAPNEVTNTIDKMREDGFGRNPIFGFFVAKKLNEIIGISLYYTRYSTWKGKCLYLEDIIVTEKFRGNGVGNLLFEKTKQFAEENNFISINWQVFDWNEPAINFYKKYNSSFDNQWINCRIIL